MNEEPERSNLKKAQKAERYEYSRHTDQLYWGVTQLLIAIQAGMFAGIYAAKDNPLSIGVPLWILGVALTGLLYLLSRRYRYLSDAAFKDTAMDKVKADGLKGRNLLSWAYVLLLVADLYVLLWICAQIEGLGWR